MTKKALVPLQAPAFAAAGLTGAVTATRYVGGTVSGAPASGTFVTGDWVVAQNGHIWICTAGGSPGTWVDAAGAGGAVTSVAGRTGAVVLTAADIGAGTFPGTVNAPAVGVQGASAGFNFTARDNSRTWTLYSQTGTATLYNGTTDVFTVDSSGNSNTTGSVSENGVRVYSSSNPPPYPVTSVAGRTGAVTLAVADVDTSALRFAQTIITTSESTTTTTGYVNLTTVGPQATVTVPPSGSIKVTFGSEMFNGTAGQLCRASILAQDLSNGSAVVLSPSDNESAEHVSSTANASNHSTCVFVLGGLTALVGHSILFSMQYKAGGGTANFQKRILIVEPCL